MAYQIPYQMLVPQGDAAHASMGTMDLGAIQRDRDWRQTQRNQLTTDVNDLNNKFANITAVNDEQAQLLAERKAFYDQQRQEILNGKGFITDKYNKIKLLGNQAANDPILSNVKQWTDAYNTNQLAINNIKNKDEDIAIALQKDLETRSKNPFVTHMSPEVDPTTGTYQQGAVSTNKYNQYLPTTLTEIPDLGMDASKFLKDAGTEELIQAGLRPMGKGQYLAINTNKILTEADALKQAADYIANSSKYQDFFNLKAQGRQLRGQSWTEAEKRQYIEDAVRGAALNARTNDYDVNNLDLTPNYSGSGSGRGTGYDYTETPPPQRTPVGTSTNEAQTSTSTITNSEQLISEKGRTYGQIDVLKKELELDKNSGGQRLTAADRTAKQAQLAGLRATAKDLEVFEQDFIKNAATRTDYVGTTAKKVLRLQKANVLKPDKSVDISGGARVKVGDFYYTQAQLEKKYQYADTPVSSLSEILDVGYALNSKDPNKRKQISKDQKALFAFQKQKAENVIGQKLTDYEFTRAIQLAKEDKVGSEKDTYATKKLIQTLNNRRATNSQYGTSPLSQNWATTSFDDVLTDKVKSMVVEPHDKHLSMYIGSNQSKIAPAKTIHSLELPAVNKKDAASLTTLESIGKSIGTLSDYVVLDHNGKKLNAEQTKGLTAINAWTDDVKNVGQHYIDGKIPVTIMRTTPPMEIGGVKYGGGNKQYTILIDPRENPAAVQSLANHINNLYIEDPNGNAVENVMNMLSGRTSPTAEAYKEFEASLPEQKDSKFHLRTDNRYSKKGALSTVYTQEQPSMTIRLTNKETGAGKVNLSTSPTVVLYGNLKKKYPGIVQKLSKLPKAIDQEQFANALKNYSVAEQAALVELVKLRDLNLARWDKKAEDVNNREEAAMLMQEEDKAYSDAIQALSALTPTQLSALLKK